jgi:hypothetical protein
MGSTSWSEFLRCNNRRIGRRSFCNVLNLTFGAFEYKFLVSLFDGWGKAQPASACWLPSPFGASAVCRRLR